jgi:hypothetical protein
MKNNKQKLTLDALKNAVQATTVEQNLSKIVGGALAQCHKGQSCTSAE